MKNMNNNELMMLNGGAVKVVVGGIKLPGGTTIFLPPMPKPIPKPVERL